MKKSSFLALVLFFSFVIGISNAQAIYDPSIAVSVAEKPLVEISSKSTKAVEIEGDVKKEADISDVVINKNTQVKIEGDPIDFKDQKIAKDGYTAEWKYDKKFFDAKCVKKLKLEKDKTWIFDCKTKKAGTTSVSVIIKDKDGKVYDSNKIDLTIANYKTLPISIDYIETAGLDKNVIADGRISTIYGKNLNTENTKIVIKGKTRKSDVKIDVYNPQAESVSFFGPFLPAGEYELYAERDGKKSNVIKVKLTDSQFTQNSAIKFTFPTSNSVIKKGNSYVITWTGLDSSTPSYEVSLINKNTSEGINIGRAVMEKTQAMTWNVPQSIIGGQGYFIEFSGGYSDTGVWSPGYRSEVFTISR